MARNVLFKFFAILLAAALLLTAFFMIKYRKRYHYA